MTTKQVKEYLHQQLTKGLSIHVGMPITANTINDVQKTAEKVFDQVLDYLTTIEKNENWELLELYPKVISSCGGVDVIFVKKDFNP